jgi:hypothetical protein
MWMSLEWNLFDTAKPLIDMNLQVVQNNIDNLMCQPECQLSTAMKLMKFTPPVPEQKDGAAP